MFLPPCVSLFVSNFIWTVVNGCWWNFVKGYDNTQGQIHTILEVIWVWLAHRAALVEVKVKAWTLAIVPLTWVRPVTSSALQSRKWQLIGMSWWCHSALCGHPLPALTDIWTHGAASRHTNAPPSPHSRNYYLFPVPLRVWGWVGLSTQ